MNETEYIGDFGWCVMELSKPITRLKLLIYHYILYKNYLSSSTLIINYLS